ncbi:MAG: DUF2314 domain-containing protein [Gemmataceae bacterium]
MMSDENASPVFMGDNSDPQMQQAYERARATFRYFWRELSWERRRIIPALQMAAIKAPFWDETDQTGNIKVANQNPSSTVEQMWVGDLDFDGRTLRGTLLNAPNWLQSVARGDTVDLPFERLSDWMYVIDDQVFGGFTIQHLRSQMPPEERDNHDAAWGLNFGDPTVVRLVPTPPQRGQAVELSAVLAHWYSPQQSDFDEHPMSLAMAEKLREHLVENPDFVHDTNDDGWTYLHLEALAGNLAMVQVLLDAGADPTARTADGRTALQLAHTLGWERIVAYLASR